MFTLLEITLALQKKQKQVRLLLFTQGFDIITQGVSPVKETEKLPLCSRCKKLPVFFEKPYFTFLYTRIKYDYTRISPSQGSQKGLPFCSRCQKLPWRF